MERDEWNPFWHAVNHVEGNIPEDKKEFDPIAFGGPEIIDSVARNGGRVQDRENVKSGDDYRLIKAAYLLGLAAGLEYAKYNERVTEATFDKLRERYNQLFPRFGSKTK